MERQRHILLAAVVTFTASWMLTGCGTGEKEMEEGEVRESWEGVHNAISSIQPTAGNTCKGSVTFEDVTGGIHVHASLSGLAPNSQHGFHVHEFAFCGSADATCTGGHYDPEKTGHHALPGASEGHHAGDMGNIVADANGNAEYDAVIKGISIAGENAIIGRAVIIHGKPDDGGQPTGNAGSRIGVGDIGIAAPPAAKK